MNAEMDVSENYKYYSFDSVNSILYHEVTEENFGDKESFVISLSYFVTLIEKLKPKAIIISLYKKPGYFELELKNFMQITLYKAIINTGIKKVAYFVSNEEYISDLMKNERDDSIKVKFFLDLESAKQWVLD